MIHSLKKLTRLMVVIECLIFGAAASATTMQFTKTVPAPGLSIQSMDEMDLTEEMKAELRDEIEQVKTGIYTPVANAKFTSLSNQAELAKQKKGKSLSLASITDSGKLNSAPSSVSDTLLHNATLLSAATSGVYQHGQWSGLSRIFFTDDLGIVTLDENNYVSVGGSITMAIEAVNENINGAPAILTIKKSVTGENLIQLTWVTNRKNYVLSSNANDIESAKSALVMLARKIKDQ